MDVRDSRILVVDDHEPNIALLRQVLRRAEYSNLVGTTDPYQALELYRAIEPDLVILDMHMPGMDGFAVMEQMRQEARAEEFVPVLILTADISPATRKQALGCEATDFITKPFDATEVLLRITNMLKIRSLHVQLQEQKRTLEERVAARTEELVIAKTELLSCLARAAEFRDDETGQHTQRVGGHAALTAQALGLSDEEAAMIRQAAPLHDLGKLGIPDTILLKPGPLSEEEMAAMRSHTELGAAILSRSHFPVLRMAEQIALTHHERWDGTGYPRSLSGDAIPLAGRIVAVADVFDALTHDRPYKQAWPVADAVAELLRQSGKHFDPAVVDAFLEAVVGRQAQGTMGP